ncbi:MAG: hypothetical protein ACI9R3_004921 [Verrucomicrobiales bacterium]|jgi:hypothetical protein
MKSFVRRFLFVIFSVLACEALQSHPRPEIEGDWVSTVGELEKLEENTRSLALDIKIGGNRSLIDVVVKRFPNLQELKIYSFPHEIHPSIFENVGKLKQLRSLELSGDAKLSEKDFALIGRLTSLKHLSFSLP